MSNFIFLSLTQIFCKTLIILTFYSQLLEHCAAYPSQNRTLAKSYSWYTEELIPVNSQPAEHTFYENDHPNVTNQYANLAWELYNAMVNLTEEEFSYENSLFLDQPMADQPADSSENNKWTNQSSVETSKEAEVKANRALAKQVYLESFKERVKSLTGWSGSSGKDPPSKFSTEQTNLLNKAYNGAQHRHQQAIQYPEFSFKIESSCSVPEHIRQSNLWTNSSSDINLYFNISRSLHKPSKDNVVAITSAVFRLYKIKPNLSSKVDVDNNPSPVVVDALEKRKISSTVVEEALKTSAELQKKITVKVYYYNLKKRKAGKKKPRKQLAIQELPYDYEGWIAWNITSAAIQWRNDSTNFGLVVEVEDADQQNSLPAQQFFTTSNCTERTEDQHSPLLPSAFLDLLSEESRKELIEQFPPTYDPQLDISYELKPVHEILISTLDKTLVRVSRTNLAMFSKDPKGKHPRETDQVTK